MFLGSIRDDDENLVLKGIRRAPASFFLSFFLSPRRVSPQPGEVGKMSLAFGAQLIQQK